MTFRLDDLTREQLKQSSSRLSLTESKFIREAIWHYENLVGKIKGATDFTKRLKEAEEKNEYLTQRIKQYEVDKNLNQLFDQLKGQTLNGVHIANRSDVVRILAAQAKIETVTSSSGNKDRQLDPIVLVNHEPNKGLSLDEPLHQEDNTAWFKRNWLVWVLLAIVAMVYFVQRHSTKLGKQPKYTPHLPFEYTPTEYAHTTT